MAANGSDYMKHEHLDSSHDSDNALQKIRTAGSISISPELFEKIYLSPQNAVKGELRKTFGNPTPICLVGFLLCLTPLSCDLMNFRDSATGNGAASIGAYFFMGATLMILGAIGEWIVGNTFPFVVFGSFGAFWGVFGLTLYPYSGSIVDYATSGSLASADALTEGLDSPNFLGAFGFFLLWMGVLCLLYMILALRTNAVFVAIFFCLVPAFSFLTAWFWYLQEYTRTKDAHTMVLAGRFREAGGAFAFVVCVLGWWIWFAIMLAALDFPFQLPVGDLSAYVPSGSSKRA